MDENVAPYRQTVTILAHLPPLLDELGVPLVPVLDGTGISPEDLAPGAFVS